MSIFITAVLLMVGAMIIKFFIELKKDSDDLRFTTAPEKFRILAQILNNTVYDGIGEVTILDKRNFNLYAEGSNQLIQFAYSTGSLTIVWRYKYFQKEVRHKRIFHNMRNVSIFTQQKIAETMIEDMIGVIQRHQIDVLTGK